MLLSYKIKSKFRECDFKKNISIVLLLWNGDTTCVFEHWRSSLMF